MAKHSGGSDQFAVKIASLMKGGIEPSDTPPKFPAKFIPMVPTVMGRVGKEKDFEKCFEPEIMVIGPHRFDEKSESHLHFEFINRVKRDMAKEFLMGKPQEVMYHNILKEIEDLEQCYEEFQTNDMKEEDLSWMLFVDGCFVIYYTIYYIKEAVKYVVDTEEETFVQIINKDLLLLQNQLPFRVLKILMMGMESEKYKIEEFVENNIAMMLQKEARLRQQEPWQLLPSAAPQERPLYLLDLLRTRLKGKMGPAASQNVTRNGPPNWRFLRNVASLMAEGTNIKCQRLTDSLAAVSFSSYLLNADLNLPPLTIDEKTRPIIMNLVAMEMSIGYKSNKDVTSYICFLRSLVSHSEDVQELRAADVLSTYCATDEQVATKFVRTHSTCCRDSGACVPTFVVHNFDEEKTTGASSETTIVCSIVTEDAGVPAQNTPTPK